MQVRCPRCNKFGKASLGGYCQKCKDVKKRKYIMRELHKEDNGFRSDPFIPGGFGIVKEKNLLELAIDIY